MAYSFIVTTILVNNPDKITVNDIIPFVAVYDEADLAKAIAYCKLESDKDNPKYKIDVEIEYEEHPAYKAAAEKLKAKGNKFGNVPYAKYIVRVEHELESGNVLKSCSIKTITFHNI